jgi:hypothetical protein
MGLCNYLGGGISLMVRVNGVLTPFSTIFQLHLYGGGQFYRWRKTGVPIENHRPAPSH